jgi:hypothetical protein
VGGRNDASLWFTMPMGAQVWSIYIAHPDECDAIEENDGVTLNARTEILLRSTLEPSRLVAVLGHELVHACFTNAGDDLIAAIFGCTTEEIGRAEERLAAYMGPQIIDALQRSGVLRLPKLPR